MASALDTVTLVSADGSSKEVKQAEIADPVLKTEITTILSARGLRINGALVKKTV